MAFKKNESECNVCATVVHHNWKPCNGLKDKIVHISGLIAAARGVLGRPGVGGGGGLNKILYWEAPP